MRGKAKDKARERARVEEIAHIRLDGAQPLDVRDFIRSREAGENAAPPWQLAEGEPPLTDAEVGGIVAAADRLIVKSVRGDLPTLIGRHLAQRRSIYARAIAAGELSTALRCLESEAALLGLTGTGRQGKPELTHEQRVVRVVALLAPPGVGAETPRHDAGTTGGAGGGVDRDGTDPGEPVRAEAN